MSEKIQKKMIRTTSMKSRGVNINPVGKQLFSCFVFEATTGKAAQVQQFRYSSLFVGFFTRHLLSSLKCFCWHFSQSPMTITDKKEEARPFFKMRNVDKRDS